MTRTSLSLYTLAVLMLTGAAGGRGRAVAASAPDAPTTEPTVPASDTRPSDDLLMLPIVAAAIGPTWTLAPTAKTGMAVDVTVGAAIGWPRPRPAREPGNTVYPSVGQDDRYLKSTLWLQPEFGYTYQRDDGPDPRTTAQLGSLGLGVGYGSLLFAAGAYTPRLVVGALDGQLAFGLRHGITGYFLGRLFSAELSHQLLWVAGGLRQDLRLLFGLNVGALLMNGL